MLAKKEKEIHEVKHERNVCFLDARKIVGTYIGENVYASVAWRVNTTNQDNKFRSFVDELIQLEANDWPKFQEHLKRLHLAEFYQALQRVGNGKRSNVEVWAKTHVGSTTPTRSTPKSAKSPTKLPKWPTRLPKSIKNRVKNLSPIKPEQVKQKSLVPISQAGKIQMNTKVNNERPGSTFKMPSIKFHTMASTSRTKSPMRINKQCKAQGSTKPQQRTYSIGGSYLSQGYLPEHNSATGVRTRLLQFRSPSL